MRPTQAANDRNLLSDACVVLVRTQGPVNLGMVARLCGNLSISDLRLVAPQCEINCPESRKFSTHSKEFLLSRPVFPDLASAVADCGLVIGSSARVRDANLGEPMPLTEVPELLGKTKTARYALVFGNEADGLTDAEMLHCQAFVRLETFGENYSYNLSHAVAITCYHLATATSLPPPPDEPEAAPREQIEHLFRYWLGTLDRFDYFRRTELPRFEPQLRRLFNRLRLSEHDVQMLWGMLAQFNYFTFKNRGEQMAVTGKAPDDGADKPD
jgi:TrmH family RNA methyltransferase